MTAWRAVFVQVLEDPLEEQRGVFWSSRVFRSWVMWGFFLAVYLVMCVSVHTVQGSVTGRTQD